MPSAAASFRSLIRLMRQLMAFSISNFFNSCYLFKITFTINFHWFWTFIFFQFSSHFLLFRLLFGWYPFFSKTMGLPGGTVVKNLPVNARNARDMGFVPGLGRSSGVGTVNMLQYSCLANFTDREAWWATVHGLTKSWADLNDWTQQQQNWPIFVSPRFFSLPPPEIPLLHCWSLRFIIQFFYLFFYIFPTLYHLRYFFHLVFQVTCLEYLLWLY